MSFFSFLLEIAQISNFYCKKYFKKQYESSTKQDNSIVTSADIELEKEICKKIQFNYPEHGIFAEESGGKNEDAEYVWVIDPIDGTISFDKGVPLWGTLIALTYKKQPILGMLHLPCSQETIIGDGSQTLYYNSTEPSHRSLSIKPTNAIEKSTILCTDINNVYQYQQFSSFLRMIQRAKIFRTWGDCFGYYLFVMQKADIVLDPIVSYWDKMALIPIVRGANGNITDWNGKSAIEGNSIIASNPTLHKIVVSLL